MKTGFSKLMLAAGMLLTGSAGVMADTEITGYVPEITVGHIWIEGNTYQLIHGDSNDLNSVQGITECRVGTHRVTCGTLAGVGYIDRARVTVSGGAATRIEVLELKQ